jgi:hypothetical protein
MPQYLLRFRIRRMLKFPNMLDDLDMSNRFRMRSDGKYWGEMVRLAVLYGEAYALYLYCMRPVIYVTE